MMRIKDHFDALPVSVEEQWRARIRYLGYEGDLEALVKLNVEREPPTKRAKQRS